ncbi:MAG: hypothetical protein R3F51_16670 [Cyanobacteriota/Melainabacteria group bacterium]
MKKLILGSIVTALLLNSVVDVDSLASPPESNFAMPASLPTRQKITKSAVQYLEKALAAGDGSPDCYIYLARLTWAVAITSRLFSAI